MNFDEKDGFTLNDLGRRLANIIRLGTILEANYSQALARVKIGDLETDWLPWVTANSGNNKNWNPLEIDQQVMVLSPGGELNQGIILPSLYKNDAAETSPNIQSITFQDGSKISFNRSNGNLDLDIKGNATIKVAGTAQIEGANIILKGDVNLGASGGNAVARVGDKVRVDSGSSAGEWPIISGSSKVKAA